VRGAGDTHLFQVDDGAVVSFENLRFTNVRRPPGEAARLALRCARRSAPAAVAATAGV